LDSITVRNPGTRPRGHIFIEFKALWFEITDSLPQFARQANRFQRAAMNQSIEIIPAAEADHALAKELREWFEREFGSAGHWRESDYYVLLRFDGQLAGRVGVFDSKLLVGGQIMRVGGIGGVATKPEFRRHGVAGAMLSHAAEFMKSDLGVEFGFLLCRHEVSPVYAKMGWMVVRGPTTFMRAGVADTYPNDTMILPLAKRVWPSGAIDMLGLPW
jgi:aminoglycoside 2'-N-acetyltransferase I